MCSRGKDIEQQNGKEINMGLEVPDVKLSFKKLSN